LQQAGLVDPRNTLRGLLTAAAPTRNPDTFDAQWWAWEYLDDLESKNGRA